MLRRLIKVDHEWHMAKRNDRYIEIKWASQYRTARSLAELNLVEMKDNRVYLGQAYDE